MKETIEEVAETIAKGFGSENWQEIKDGIVRYAVDEKQQGKLYSEEDMKAAWENGMKSAIVLNASFEMWFEQFKKK